jgi:hypothetical protein
MSSVYRPTVDCDCHFVGVGKARQVPVNRSHQIGLLLGARERVCDTLLPHYQTTLQTDSLKGRPFGDAPTESNGLNSVASLAVDRTDGRRGPFRCHR